MIEEIDSLYGFRAFSGMIDSEESKIEEHVNYQFLESEKKRGDNFKEQYGKSNIYQFSPDTYYFSKWELNFLKVNASPSRALICKSQRN